MKLIPITVLSERCYLMPQLLEIHRNTLGNRETLVISVRFTPITRRAEHLQI